MDLFPRRDFLLRSSLGLAASALSVRAQGSEFNVRTYGATGDGKAIDTPAIHRAIDAAAAAGGGVVHFPAGTYACYSIRLKSRITLDLSPGATILAAAPPPSSGTGGYDAAEPMELDKYQDYGHSHFHNSLIWGEGLENVAITGAGLIYGKGLSKGTGPGLRAEDPHVGNKAISLKNCRNVTLRDFAILQGGHFGILATGVDDFTIDNLKIDTNRDGIDIDCCRNVRVSNTSVNSPWDDGICLKSSFGLGHARATEGVTITNCAVSGSYAMGSMLDATFKPLPAGERIPRTGRIKFGTESNGGFKNVTISNCTFDGCQGLALETVDGGLLEDVSITNITMRDIISAPIFLRLGSRMRGPAGVPVGVLRRVLISNIVCSSSASYVGSILSGIPNHAVENIKISDVYVQHQGGGSLAQAALKPDEKADAYPEPGMFGNMPSHGFYIRHAKNVEISHVEFELLKPEQRPVFVMDDVDGVDLFRIKSPRMEGIPAAVLNNVRHFSVAGSKPLMADAQLDRAEAAKF